MLGSVNLLDPELISKQKMPATILNENPLHGFMETESIEVELSDEKHMKSRFFKSLLKTHFSLRSEQAS